MSVAPQQGTHFFVLSLEKPGLLSMTQEGTCTPAPGATRKDMYQQLYQAVTAQDPALSGATVLFFSLERNQL
ncbi:hypothetical protein ABZT03_04435 [Streptomyces sp. NPDC005574]|uniref:hypothetical protein n=1 Tax=unclassified Streptomyces TaxID=2593676 RepID=UPI002256B92D|nr:hypothetical protein [Streptomyces sp. NBC_01571]MCX4575904.1 hypothetical protein [Streptomyces sp. NBC_01571]